MASAKRDTAPEPETTGHEWDGISELNKPLPKWWLYVFYATIVWAVGYWLLMPAWPLVAGYTKGLLGYSQRAQVADQLEAAKAAKAEYRQRIAASDLAAINSDPELLRFALAGGEAAFGDNCAPCHGRGAQGAFGYPNLRDDSWLWGGTLDDIQVTILHGIRADDPKTAASGRRCRRSARAACCPNRRLPTSRSSCCRSQAVPTMQRRPNGERKSLPRPAHRATAPKPKAIRPLVRRISLTSFGSMPATKPPSPPRFATVEGA
jgi:mono/diheme cytochrome c family protein